MQPTASTPRLQPKPPFPFGLAVVGGGFTLAAMANESEVNLEFDAPWKIALAWKLDEAIALCFPRLYPEIDWSQPWEDLESELPQLAPAHAEGKHTVDKLFKVRLKTGADRLLYIHLEIQAQPDGDFAVRMWVYNYRLCDRYGPAVISLAILADDRPEWRPHVYHHEFAGCVQHFEFPVFKVLDCPDPEGLFERTGNRFALLVAAHQVALRTRGDASARGRERLRLVKYLYGKGMDKEEVKLLFRLLAWLTKLPEDLELKFNEELAEYEEKAKAMTLETLLAPIELIALRKGHEQGQEEGLRKGREQGQQEGWQRGRAEAGQDWVLRLLRRRVGELTPALVSRVQALPVETLEQLGLELLDFSTVADLERWFIQQPPAAPTSAPSPCASPTGTG